MAITVEQFVAQLQNSGIISHDVLKDFVPPKTCPCDVNELAAELVRQKKLTQFQADEISKGNSKSLVLGNYVLTEKIGEGGMGTVYKAEHRRMNRTVAIKTLPPSLMKNKQAAVRFQREVEAAAKLRHPNIVAADDADEASGVHFLVMEYVEGIDLSALVKNKGPLPVQKAVNYVLQAAQGLEFAHKKGIVHRDVKPANLLLDTEGRIKILDLGLAQIDIHKNSRTELTNTGDVMGTVDYMPPEQALSSKHVDCRADIYSLGCSLFYLLTGKPTYEGETMTAKLLAHQNQPIPRLRFIRSDIPEQLDLVFERMIAKNVVDRYETMGDVITDLEMLTVGNSISATMTLVPQQTPSAIDGKLRSLQDVEVSPPTPLTEVLTGGKLRQQSIPLQQAIKNNSGKKLLLTLIAVVLAGILLAWWFGSPPVTSEGILMLDVNQANVTLQILDLEGRVKRTLPMQPSPSVITTGIVPGKYRLRARKDGYPDNSQDFEIESGRSLYLQVGWSDTPKTSTSP